MEFGFDRSLLSVCLSKMDLQGRKAGNLLFNVSSFFINAVCKWYANGIFGVNRSNGKTVLHLTLPRHAESKSQRQVSGSLACVHVRTEEAEALSNGIRVFTR